MHSAAEMSDAGWPGVVRDAAGFIGERGDELLKRVYHARLELSQEKVGATVDAHVLRVWASADVVRCSLQCYSRQEMHPHDVKMLCVAGGNAIRRILVAIRAAKVYHGKAAERAITDVAEFSVDPAKQALVSLERGALTRSMVGASLASAATVQEPVCQSDTGASAASGSGEQESAGTSGAGMSGSATEAAEPGLEGLGEHEAMPAEGAPSQGAHWQLVSSHTCCPR